MATYNLDAADLRRVRSGGLIREDVMNKIFDISRIPLPFTDMVGTDTCKNPKKEWTIDKLAPPNLNNAVVDGADITKNNNRTGNRVNNYCQISTKRVAVSQRADTVDKIGRAKELAYQIMRRQQELRRDVEAIALSNQSSWPDNGQRVAGKVGGLGSWIRTNAFASAKDGSNAARGGFNFTSGHTVSYKRKAAADPLSEEQLKKCIQSIYQQGGDASVIMTVPALVSRFSEFMLKPGSAGGGHVAQVHSTTSAQSKEAVTALGAVNVFVTDFGTVKLVPNRLQQPASVRYPNAAAVYILDPQYLSLGYLEGYRTQELAKTGLSEKRMMSVDWTLIVHNEAAHGMIMNVSMSADMVK